MTMDKKERRTRATQPHPKLHVPKIDHLVGKSFEQGHLQPSAALGSPRSNEHSIVSSFPKREYLT
jgi:hypothetical protein